MQTIPIVGSWADLRAWMTALLAAPTEKDVLTNGDKLVGMRLALHLNLKTLRCFPKVYPTLMKGTSMTRQGVQGALQRLVGGGWIVRVDRAGSSSEFKFLMIRVPVTVISQEETGEGVPTGVGT